ncbi:RNA polymerase sporulation sigma factor SigK [Haloplasma contractile]|uniref:RNA polymerase sigma factor n=1 Tax=Haloplasma contractile SSD-17B TaxID=1033810 RepID=U2FRX7_9MOLU|nr:RNA polymerase sporulation sigma factor SigK [Haloplasma contractile]ERJ13724.1 RNA polymerase sigma-28 factor protein [Haloplasma contractile SSD-17B]
MLEVIIASLLKLLPFIGSVRSKTFPETLTSDQERELLNRMYSGDFDARNLLIEHNLRLVAHIVKKYENTSEDKEDLLSIGTIGLIKAIDSYNDKKGTKLATYAARCIENEILMQLRMNKKNRNVTSLHDPIGFDKEGNKITLIDILKDDNKSVEERVLFGEKVEKLNEILPELTERELQIITRRFGLANRPPETQREIAESLNISRSYVSRIEKRALMKLYRMLSSR